MTKGSFAEMNCPIAQSLELVGEWWTLLILRNAFCGMSRFDDFQKHLGIGSNILANRLRRLCEAEILTRTAAAEDGRAFDYRLTDKGFSLYPVLLALTQWGEQWAANPLGPRLQMFERSTGKPIAGLAVLSADGRPLRPDEITVQAGPGADDKTHELIRHRAQLEAAQAARPGPA